MVLGPLIIVAQLADQIVTEQRESNAKGGLINLWVRLGELDWTYVPEFGVKAVSGFLNSIFGPSLFSVRSVTVAATSSVAWFFLVTFLISPRLRGVPTSTYYGAAPISIVIALAGICITADIIGLLGSRYFIRRCALKQSTNRIRNVCQLLITLSALVFILVDASVTCYSLIDWCFISPLFQSYCPRQNPIGVFFSLIVYFPVAVWNNANAALRNTSGKGFLLQFLPAAWSATFLLLIVICILFIYLTRVPAKNGTLAVIEFATTLPKNVFSKIVVTALALGAAVTMIHDGLEWLHH